VSTTDAGTGSANAGRVPGRIAYVISTTTGRGGAERLLVKLVEAGDARGWEQLVLNPFALELPSAYEHLAESPRYKRRRCDRATELPRVRAWLQSELEHFAPDITHVMLFHATVMVASLRRRVSGVRLLTHVYGENLRLDDGTAARTRLDCFAGRRFDHVVAISRSVQRFLAEECGQPGERLTIIPPGWEGQPMPRDERRRPPTMVCVASLRREKGHELLIAALPRVLERVPDARLVLVGDGEMRAHLEARVAAEHLEDHVEFAGSVPEVWSRLAAADVFVLTSVSEAFGMAIVEAMAAGLPVVAPDVGGIPELVVPGESGLLFPAGDHLQLGAHLVELLESPDRRARMAEAARRAAEPLRMTNTLPLYFDLYDQLLERVRRPRPTPRG
jgi:glycosyltransferase involved in cell wall biosynthesis